MVVLMVEVASAQPARDRRRPVEIPANIEIVRDVEYGTGGGRPLKMHILRPKTLPAGPMPILVWIHGGAWLGGNKDGGIFQLIPFVQRGCFCATIEYRLSQEAKFPAQIEDCKCAIRFLRAKAKEYRLDPDRIGVWGSSAGGHLVAMLGVTGGVKELEGKGGWPDFSSRVNAVCDWFGPSDFSKMADAPSRINRHLPTCPEALLIGGSLQENKEKAAKASPVTYVTKEAPPFLIMHGDQDDVVPYNQSELLYEALKKAGVEVTFHPVKGAGHGFGGPEIMKMVSEFFEKHLRISGGGK
jgi:acetyl esterase/lipase